MKRKIIKTDLTKFEYTQAKLNSYYIDCSNKLVARICLTSETDSDFEEFKNFQDKKGISVERVRDLLILNDSSCFVIFEYQTK